MSQTEEKKQAYEVWIFRRDGEHICSFSSLKYDECYEDWKVLVDKWKQAVTDKVPFTIDKPVVTAFDPGIISEITVRPVIKITESKYNNPYQQEMMKKGLGASLKNNGNIINPDMLDEGYR